jgi:hypothetical protein
MLFARSENESWECSWSVSEKMCRENWDSSYFFTVRANKFAWWKIGLSQSNYGYPDQSHPIVVNNLPINPHLQFIILPDASPV